MKREITNQKLIWLFLILLFITMGIAGNMECNDREACSSPDTQLAEAQP